MTVFSVNEGNIRKRIRAACSLAGISITELGEKMGFVQSNFSQKMKNGRFTKQELEQMAKILGCKYICFFELEDGQKVFGATIGEMIRTASKINKVPLSEIGRQFGITQPSISKRVTLGKFTQEELGIISEIVNCKYISYFLFDNGTTI